MRMETLRDYVSLMEERNLVLEIKEKVALPDIPGLIEILSDKGKLLLFRDVEGYDCHIVANLVPSQGALEALMGGHDPYAAFLEGVRKTAKKVPVEGEKLETRDVTKEDLAGLLPMLKHCEKDSAPFITTGIVSCVDPDTGVVGRGIHRMEYRGGNRLGLALLNPPLSDIFTKYKERGVPMLLTVTLGVDPLLFLSMALKPMGNIDKLEVAGGLKGAGIRVIDSFDSEIDVPAGAEFYLEGYVDPDDMRQDGPLGEISGYYLTLDATPTMVVRRISHPHHPLYHALLPTGPEGDVYLTFVSRAHIEENVKKLFPFIERLVFVRKTFGTSVVVSVRPTDRSKVRSMIVGMLAFPMVKKVVAVDSDVNAEDLRDVEWALMTRCASEHDLIILPALQGQPIDPEAGAGFGVTKIGFDATTQGKNIGGRARVSVGNRRRIEELSESMGGGK